MSTLPTAPNIMPALSTGLALLEQVSQRAVWQGVVFDALPSGRASSAIHGQVGMQEGGESGGNLGSGGGREEEEVAKAMAVLTSQRLVNTLTLSSHGWRDELLKDKNARAGHVDPPDQALSSPDSTPQDQLLAQSRDLGMQSLTSRPEGRVVGSGDSESAPSKAHGDSEGAPDECGEAPGGSKGGGNIGFGSRVKQEREVVVIEGATYLLVRLHPRSVCGGDTGSLLEVADGVGHVIASAGSPLGMTGAVHGADGSRAKRGVCGVMKGPTETLVVAGDTCVLTFRDGGGGAYQATVEGYAAPGLTVHVSQMHLPQPHTISQASRGVYGGSELLLAQVSFVYFCCIYGGAELSLDHKGP